ncbi:hypothetical protein [Paenibacillus sp. FSL H7-0331]|nr:hypothetical protein [Paenibacillus sp. FSL H7-0331]
MRRSTGADSAADPECAAARAITAHGLKPLSGLLERTPFWYSDKFGLKLQ